MVKFFKFIRMLKHIIGLSFWFIIMVIGFPIDYIGWNVFFADGKKLKYRSFKTCIKDGWNQLQEFRNNNWEKGLWTRNYFKEQIDE